MQRVRIGVLTYGGILALELVVGSVRMAFFPPQSATLQVASITDEHNHFSIKYLSASREKSLELGERLFQQSRQQSQAGAGVIIWQEGAIIAAQADKAHFIEQARALAQEEKGYLLLGLVTVPEGFPKARIDNRAVWIMPDCDVKWQYRKERPVPGMESLVAGDGVIPVDQTGSGVIASVICFDMDHPVYIR